MEKVPVLEFETDGKKIYLSESTAICEFLEEIFPENSLLPKDPILRSKARMICSEINSGIQPFQNLGTLNKIEKDFNEKRMNGLVPL